MRIEQSHVTLVIQTCEASVDLEELRFFQVKDVLEIVEIGVLNDTHGVYL